MAVLKEEKEAFVSGHGGTSVAEINILTAVAMAGFLLRCSILIVSPTLYRRACSQPILSILLDFCFILLPGVFVFTVMADYAVYLLIAELLISLILLWSAYCKSQFRHPIRNMLEIPFPRRQPYLTLVRTFVNIFTAIAILAVDFHIFPRRLAKAETFGSGLMDVGVGAFMMAHGVTSPEAREQKGSGLVSNGYTKMVMTTAKSVLPLLVLGLVRTLLLKTTGYQEHVTEYGVHWNFFFTIATVRLLCSLLRPLLVCLPCGYGITALALTLLYQSSLLWGGLESYVLLGPNGDGSRRGLLSANREGVVSCVGYFIIYVGWIEIGKWLFRSRKVVKEYFVVLFTLLMMFVLLSAATYWSNQSIHSISRRMVNISYILWIFSYGTFLLLFFLISDIIILTTTQLIQSPAPPLYDSDHTSDSTHSRTSQRRAPPPPPTPLCLVSAVDYNQLAFFLLANVLTGVVNFLVDTLHAGPVLSLVVIGCYMASLQLIATGLHIYKIKLKL